MIPSQMTEADFEAFLKETDEPKAGLKVFRASGELKALLSRSRTEILKLRAGKTSAARPAATAPVAAVRTTPPAAKPAANSAANSAPVRQISAAEFIESQARPVMSRADFNSLNHVQRNAYMKSGGRLVD